MKTLYSLPAVLISILLTTGVQAQEAEATGLPGDNFSLEGALEMFKKAGSPQEFEKLLNTKENGVNNLDLNGDGDIDYIRIVNKKDKNVQLFVLQALVSPNESQDVAVIELERTGNAEAMIQIVGDEDIYGVSRIVEPLEEDVTAFNDAPVTDRPHGPNAAFGPSGIIVNVWYWPSVRFVFAPHYTIWVSPWRWYHYPVWWNPWRPLAWHVYQPICYHYRPRYVVVHTHRVVRAHHIYRPMRVSSVSVRNRHYTAVNNYRRTVAVNTPSREFNRTSVTRGNSGREINRSSSTVNGPRRDINRSSTTVNGPRRDINRSNTTVNGPRRQINRGNTTVTGPRGGQINRSNTTVNGPRREINRGNTTVTGPQGRQINRSSTTVNGPRRDINHRNTTVTGPQRQVNRSATNINSRQRQVNSRSTTVNAPQRQVNRSSTRVSAPQGRSAAPTRATRDRRQ
ncbi:hypothetical protein [Chitinophaga sp. XS-30]|uniref:hypothetical protein n=1 Tax=Chitinophaga sp. XS-30 TaxID=2604421 RepID=UPI001AEF8CD3|nr:hypothetical protein [Chitinophaga sp. XS-30]